MYHQMSFMAIDIKKRQRREVVANPQFPNYKQIDFFQMKFLLDKH